MLTDCLKEAKKMKKWYELLKDANVKKTQYLISVDDLQTFEIDNNVSLPEEYKANVYLADHFSDEKNERVRKTILSKGNDCIRNIEEQMNHFDIRLKK